MLHISMLIYYVLPISTMVLFSVTLTPGGLTNKITTVVSQSILPLMYRNYRSGLPPMIYVPSMGSSQQGASGLESGQTGSLHSCPIHALQDL